MCLKAGLLFRGPQTGLWNPARTNTFSHPGKEECWKTCRVGPHRFGSNSAEKDLWVLVGSNINMCQCYTLASTQWTASWAALTAWGKWWSSFTWHSSVHIQNTASHFGMGWEFCRKGRYWWIEACGSWSTCSIRRCWGRCGLVQPENRILGGPSETSSIVILETGTHPSQWCWVGRTGESRWDLKRKFQARYKENFGHYKVSQAVGFYSLYPWRFSRSNCSNSLEQSDLTSEVTLLWTDLEKGPSEFSLSLSGSVALGQCLEPELIFFTSFWDMVVSKWFSLCSVSVTCLESEGNAVCLLQWCFKIRYMKGDDIFDALSKWI